MEEEYSINQKPQSHANISNKKLNFDKKKFRQKKIFLKISLVFLLILFISFHLLFLKIKVIKKSRFSNHKETINFLKKKPENNIFSGINSIDYYRNAQEKMEALNKGKTYIESCLNGTLFNNKTFFQIEEPLISVVIPIYNSQSRIKSVLSSVQNQNITNIEIILVNDASTDNTPNIIENIQNYDKRIKIINNLKQRGTLYSRCIGTLATKGKYIFPLDNDDLFFDEELFDIILKEAINGNFDIVEFIGVEHNNYRFNIRNIKKLRYSDHKNNLILYQPELGQFPRKKNNEYGCFDIYLWGKCINSLIYKDTINSLGESVYSNYITWGEDYITSFILFRKARSFKFIRKYGMFKFRNLITASNNTPRQTYFLANIIYLEVILKWTNNSFVDKNYVVHIANNMLRQFYPIRINLNNENQELFRKVLINVVNNKFIKNKDKAKIIMNSNKNFLRINSTSTISSFNSRYI